MELKSFKQILKNAANRTPMPFVRRVQSVWHVALMICLGGILGVIIFSLFLYIQIQNDSLFQSQATASEINNLIKQTRLDSVLQDYETKKENFDKFSISKPIILDPSQ